MSDLPSVGETVAALTFSRHNYTNVYRHPRRITEAYLGNIGGIKGFVQTLESTGGINGELGFLGSKVGARKERKRVLDVEFEVVDPLLQALVTRAYLANEGLLGTDVTAARPMAYVIARGAGAVPYPDPDETWAASLGAQVPADVATEVLAEHANRLGARRTDDSHPEYWPAVAKTRTGIAIAFLGGAELDHSNAVNWIKLPVSCCIFGTKVRDGSGWTLIMPFHVWFEPPQA